MIVKNKFVNRRAPTSRSRPIQPTARAAPERRPGGRPALISRDLILDEAGQIPAHELTMPVVARRLGVDPSALYYHFESRDALLAAQAARLVQKFILRPADPARWRSWLLGTAADLRQLFLDNPVILTVHEWSRIARVGLPLLETALETLEEAGFPSAEAMHVWSAVANYVYAYARAEHEALAAPRGRAAREQEQEDMFAQIERPLPRARALVESIRGREPAALFEESLRWLVNILPEPERKPAGAKSPRPAARSGRAR